MVRYRAPLNSVGQLNPTATNARLPEVQRVAGQQASVNCNFAAKAVVVEECS